MDSSIFWDNVVLLLSGIVILFSLVLFFSVRALISYSQEEHNRQSIRRPPRDARDVRDDWHDNYLEEDSAERDFENEAAGYRNDDFADGHDQEAWEEREYRPPARQISVASRIREPRQLAIPGKSIWFVVGIICGAGGMGLWVSISATNNPTTTTAISNFGQASNPPANEQVSSPPVNGQASSPPVNGQASGPLVNGQPSGPPVNATPNPTATALEPVTNVTTIAPPTAEAQPNPSDAAAVFAASLKQNLPLPVQPGVTITAVTAEGTIVLLVFNIAEPIADEDIEKLRVDMEQSFHDGVCATEPFPDNIHGLSNVGVTFLVNYYDLLEKNVMRFSAKPNFCTNPT